MKVWIVKKAILFVSSLQNLFGLLSSNTFLLALQLKGVQRPAAFAIVFVFCEFRTVIYSVSCADQVADFAQSMLVFVVPLIYGDKWRQFINRTEERLHKLLFL